MFLTIASKQAVRVCDKCVTQIRSMERPHLPHGVEESSDDGSEARSVTSAFSDGKCKATERPFRSTLSLMKNDANAAQHLRNLQESDDDDEELPDDSFELDDEPAHQDTAEEVVAPVEHVVEPLALDEVAQYQPPSQTGTNGDPALALPFER
jgi:hypothetical protein